MKMRRTPSKVLRTLSESHDGMIMSWIIQSPVHVLKYMKLNYSLSKDRFCKP